MGDYERYQQMSHEQLFEQLKVGRPGQVESLAADWATMQRTLDDLVTRLEEDVRGLLRNWDGPAGREFQYRLGLVNSFTREISGDMSSVHEGLNLMSAPLRTAQKKAESPEETDDHDKAAKGATIGGLLGGPPGALVGGLLGNSMDNDEKDKARQRMVDTVTTLAAAYDVAGHSRWPGDPTPPSPEMPGSTSGLGAGERRAAGPHAVAAGPVTGPGGSAEGRVAGDPTIPGQPGDPGDGGLANQVINGGDPSADVEGSILLGAAAAAAVGLAGTVRGSITPSGPATGARPPGSSLLGSAQPGGVRGVLGREGMGHDAATAGRGVGRGASGLPHGDGHSDAQTAGKSAVGGRSTGDADEDEGDEHLTWLTEDEMVWGTDGPAPPSVLGGDKPA